MRNSRTAVVIHSGLAGSGRRKPADLFSAAEIDRMDEGMLAGKSREALLALRQKLSDTFDWLDSGDCGIGSPEMLAWEKRLDRLNNLLDNIDWILDSEEELENEDEW